jgi:hypothetical protein
MNSFFARRRVWLMKIAVTAAFVVIANKTVNWSHCAGVLRGLSPVDIAIAVLLSAAGIFLGAKRWENVMDILGAGRGIGPALRTYLWGNTLAFITPGRVIAAARIAYTVWAVLMDKVLIFAALLAWTVAGTAVQYLLFRVLPPFWFVAAQGVCAAAGAAVVVAAFVAPARRVTETGYAGRVRAFTRSLASCSGLRSIAYSLAAHFTLLFQTALIVRMLGMQGFTKCVCAAAQAYFFMALFPVFIANMGIREYSFARFLRLLRPETAGQSSIESIALGASLIILLANIVLPALAGLVWTLGNALTKKARNKG